MWYFAALCARGDAAGLARYRLSLSAESSASSVVRRMVQIGDFKGLRLAIAGDHAKTVAELLNWRCLDYLGDEKLADLLIDAACARALRTLPVLRDTWGISPDIVGSCLPRLLYYSVVWDSVAMAELVKAWAPRHVVDECLVPVVAMSTFFECPEFSERVIPAW